MTRNVIPTTRRLTGRGAVWLAVAIAMSAWAAFAAYGVLTVWRALS